jgi:hypothetical protein
VEKDLFDDEPSNLDAENTSLYANNTHPTRPIPHSLSQAISSRHALLPSQPPSSFESLPAPSNPQSIEPIMMENCTVTDLDLTNNFLGKEFIEGLAVVMKSNQTLRSLHLDCLYKISPSTTLSTLSHSISSSISTEGNDRGGVSYTSRFHHVLNECRIFNNSLKILSLSDTHLSLATFDHLMRLFDGDGLCTVERLYLARCGITAMHMRKSSSHLQFSRHLTHLTLSGNKLTDQGMHFITDVYHHHIHQNVKGEERKNEEDEDLREERDREEEYQMKKNLTKGFGLKYLDVSTCGVTMASALNFMKVISHSPTGSPVALTYLDLSDNDLHSSISTMKDFSSHVSQTPLTHLILNRCHLGVAGASSLFSALSLLNASPLLSLTLAENEIKDSACDALKSYLDVNTSLSFLDLGFNHLTSAGVEKLKSSQMVLSSASDVKKVNELHINLI